MYYLACPDLMEAAGLDMEGYGLEQMGMEVGP